MGRGPGRGKASSPQALSQEPRTQALIWQLLLPIRLLLEAWAGSLPALPAGCTETQRGMGGGPPGGADPAGLGLGAGIFQTHPDAPAPDPSESLPETGLAKVAPGQLPH